MNLSPKTKEVIAKAALYGLAGIAIYHIIKGDSVKKSVEKAVSTPKGVIDAVVKEIDNSVKTAKGKLSREEFLKKMAAGRESKAGMTKKDHDSNNKKSYWKW